jgi:hypothetical protein
MTKNKIEVLAKAGIKREPGYLYFVTKTGDAARVPMARGRKKQKGAKKKPEVLFKAGIKREAGFLYFIDKAGNISRTKMARGKGHKA